MEAAGDRDGVLTPSDRCDLRRHPHASLTKAGRKEVPMSPIAIKVLLAAGIAVAQVLLAEYGRKR